MSTRHSLLALALLLTLTGTLFAQPIPPKRVPTYSPSDNSIIPASLATDLAAAMDIPANLVKTATLGTSDPKGATVFASPINTFPVAGNSFAVISTGKAKDAPRANAEENWTTQLDGLNTADDGNDLVQLTLKLKVPTNATYWAVDFKFFSEEFKEYVGSPFNDAFLIETPDSTFTIDPVTFDVTAPNNVAFDPDGNLVTINATGPTGMTFGNAFGTTYDGATTNLTAYAPIPGGSTQIKIVFSVMDISDSSFDTTVFLDNFRFVFGDTPPGDSARPVFDVPPSPDAGTVFTTDIGELLTIDLQATDPDANDTVNEFGVLEDLTGINFATTAGNPGTTVFTWTPVAGQEGIYVLPFIAIDDNGTPSLPHTLVIVAGNIAPLAVNDVYEILPNDPFSEFAPGILDNDSDVNEDPLIVNTTPVTAPTSGNLTLNADGSFTYTPDPAFYGVDFFVYEVSDGEFTDTATVLLQVGDSLLLNQGFEIAGFASNADAQSWLRPSGVDDKRICDKPAKNKFYAFTGSCALQMTGSIGAATTIKQKVTNSTGVAGDQVVLNAWVKAANLTTGGRVQVIIKLSDGTKQKLEVTINTGSYAYILISGNITLTGTTAKLITKISMIGGGGKYWIDEVFVAIAPAALGTGTLALPEAPSSLGTR